MGQVAVTSTVSELDETTPSGDVNNEVAPSGTGRR